VHESRQKQGLGGTYHSTGYHDNMQQDRNFTIDNGIHLRLDALVTGQTTRPFLNTHFTRFHESAEDYSDFHGDIDDHDLF